MLRAGLLVRAGTVPGKLSSHLTWGTCPSSHRTARHLLTLGCEVHGVPLHRVGRAPLVPARVAVGVAVHVAMVGPWVGGAKSVSRGCGEEKLAPGGTLGFAESAPSHPCPRERQGPWPQRKQQPAQHPLCS